MESGNDYVIQVKGNQPNLLKAIKQKFDNTQSKIGCTALERKRGRIENRQVQILRVESESDKIFKQWKGLQTIIHVKNYGHRKDTQYNKDHYYISSIKEKSAEYYAEGIRSHWGVENRLHWVKDVIMNEDKSRIITGQIAKNLSLIKSIVINLFRLNGSDSIQKAIESYCNRPRQAMTLVDTTKHI